MNYNAARQRKLSDGSAGQWDYTRRNDDRIWPIGYCAGWRETSEETIRAVYGGRDSASFRKDEALREKFRPKYHSTGHASKEEACDCYREFVLDNRLRLDGRMSHQDRCQAEGCGDWTQRLAEVDHQVFPLCDKHCTREEVEKLFGSVGETISSW